MGILFPFTLCSLLRYVIKNRCPFLPKCSEKNGGPKGHVRDWGQHYDLCLGAAHARNPGLHFADELWTNMSWLKLSWILNILYLSYVPWIMGTSHSKSLDFVWYTDNWFGEVISGLHLIIVARCVLYTFVLLMALVSKPLSINSITWHFTYQRNTAKYLITSLGFSIIMGIYDIATVTLLLQRFPA